MANNTLNYQVPESSTINCPSYFKSTPLCRWSVHDYALHAQLESSCVKKAGKSSEQFYNALKTIKNSNETPSDVKRLLNSIIPKMKTSKPKEIAQVSIRNRYSQCAVSNSGNASLVLNSLASNENSKSSASNISENTAAQSKMPALNKGKRKATEIEEGSELQIPVPPDDSDALDSLFKNPLPTPVPSLSPSEFRSLVYIYGSKALSKTFYMADSFAVENLIQAFNPTTLGEQLDVMSAKLAMSIDLSNIMQVNALKLSLSRIIDTVNNGVTSIFRQYLNNQFWERLNDVNMNINEGMSVTAKQLYQEILTRGTINDKIDKKEIRIAIAEEKLSMLKSDQTECVQILDILDIITKPCLTDRSIRSDDDASELTCYRKFAKVLDEILDNTMLDILDGERVSKASKTVAKNLEKTYNSNIPLHNGFGRRIDLILATKDIELSTSEWKKKKTPAAKCLQQQAKNIRINKAILRYFLDLPISEADKNKVMTVGMDWTGNMGYMFAVKPLDDVFVTKTLYTLTIPTYIDELPYFRDTLDHLYSWRNYHVLIKDIILRTLFKREKERFFYSVLGSSTTTTTNGSSSPNIYLTPTQSRRRRAKSEIQDEEQEEYQEDYEDEDE
ncbi:hypothetical protein INT47_003383 [Mucor saturninus]|uniref:Uncharacterized protein n=1 Tax=Mucor saturninus TaxID=64648 RepID=A0A8H7VB20_9FUNG|nr:hypothetical protein INT47_003383 [Mucor saturninus]